MGIQTDVHDIAVKTNQSISVYPNPATSTVSISTNDPGNTSAIITMYNQTGSIIRQTRLVNTTATFSLEGIQPGVYVLKGETGTGVKLIIK